MISYVDVLKTVNEQAALAKDFPSVTLRFLRNYTIEKIEPFLQQILYAAKLKPILHFGGYNTAQQEVWQDVTSEHSEIVVLTLLLDQLDPDYNDPHWDSTRVQSYLAELLASLAAQTAATVVVNTFFLPLYTEQGLGSSPVVTDKIAALNQLLSAFVADHNRQFVLVDWNRLLRQVGAEQAFDRRNWLMFADPFRPAFLAAYAGELARVVRALTGKAKKCLLLDCDNTLWGGVVGEAGPEGIQLDRNSYPGKVYYEFQKTVVHLVERGVLVALCSKNNPQDVWDIMDNHPHCLVKRQHLAAWQVNWDDKATNVQRLAQQLNLGLDSFVFVDDSASECELIRQLCPEVTVRQVPGKLSSYPTLLLKDGLFDTLAVSQEDQQRTQLYQQQQQRQAVQQTYQTLAEYLVSLQTVVTVARASLPQAARIAQLTQKTNQFNLTTRRYSESEIVRLIADPEHCFVACATVSDCFGDMGLTGVLIVRRTDRTAVVDSLLLSCRILGRNIEQAFWQACAQRLTKLWELADWQAAYIPTAKNGQVADFWLQAGFESLTDYHYYLTAKNLPSLALPHIKVIWTES